jgi:ATP-binding protein involved in chromosome partitioning
MDPRLSTISRRFENINRLIAVSGGKGGIGKSSTASLLALSLIKSDYKVGLLDLDLCGPSAHIILGIKGIYPKEKKGIVPPEVYGIKFMSIVHYTNDKPLALRGIDISNGIIELLTITQWGSLDFLIIDMPPGIGDVTLDIIRLIKRIEFLIVATKSKVVLETVKKLLKILVELKIPIIGIIENMKFTESLYFKEEARGFSTPLLGSIAFDSDLEDAVGDIEQLIKTKFYKGIEEIAFRVIHEH